MNTREKQISKRISDARANKTIKQRYSKFPLRAIEVSTFNDTVVLNTVTNNAVGSAPYLLNPVVTGDSQNQVSGIQYLLSSISVKGRVRFDPSAAAATLAQVRLVLMIDHMSAGGYTGISKVFAQPTNAENSTLAYRDRNWLDRFTVLHDKTIMMTPRANIQSTEYSEVWEQFSMYSYLENMGLEVRLSDAAGTAPMNHSIFLLAFGYPTGVTLKLDAQSVCTYKGP